MPRKRKQDADDVPPTKRRKPHEGAGEAEERSSPQQEALNILATAEKVAESVARRIVAEVATKAEQAKEDAVSVAREVARQGKEDVAKVAADISALREDLRSHVAGTLAALAEVRAGGVASAGAPTPPTSDAPSGILSLNVGGMVFTTRRSTLRRVPDSFLDSMFSGRFSLEVDGEGRAFIDRDGKHFATILNWLRDGRAPLPDCEDFRREAEYYGLAEAMFAAESVQGFPLVVGGVDDNWKTLASAERLNPETGAWEALPPMSTPREGLGLAVLDGMVYAVGGGDGRDWLASVERFDPVEGRWEAVAPMSEARGYPGCVVVGGKLYAVGGWNGGRLLEAVERFDPATSAWEQVAPLSAARSNVACAVVDGKLYAVGGVDGDSDTLSTVERFDPSRGVWEAVAPMASARWGHACAVVDGKLYAVGGENEEAEDDDTWGTVERFDPASGAWEAVAPMAVPRRSHACAVLDRKLYALGGKDVNAVALASIEVFDPTAGRWNSAAANLLSPRASGAACFVDLS